jgi:hypothetical protein
LHWWIESGVMKSDYLLVNLNKNSLF